MKYCLLYLSILLLLGACSEEKIEIPEDVLPKETMRDLLIDIHLAEALVINHRFRVNDSARAAYYILRDKIFKVYQTDSSAYHKSYGFYGENTDMLEEIYQAVVDSLRYKDSITVADKPSKIPIVPKDDIVEIKTEGEAPVVTRKSLRDAKIPNKRKPNRKVQLQKGKKTPKINSNPKQQRLQNKNKVSIQPKKDN